MNIYSGKIRGRKFMAAILTGFIIASLGLYIASSQTSKVTDGFSGESTEITFLENSTDSVSIDAEIAKTPEEKRKGLMYRESLGENRGMIFVYEDEDVRRFWMKNTLIPLDMIFVTSEKRIANIEQAYPEPGVKDTELKRYSSEVPVQYVIETNVNFSERHGIEENDSVEFVIG